MAEHRITLHELSLVVADPGTAGQAGIFRLRGDQRHLLGHVVDFPRFTRYRVSVVAYHFVQDMTEVTLVQVT
jgi:hypothetical protein